MEANQQSESQTLMPMGKKQLEAVKQIIDDLGAGEGQGAQIEAVYQRTSSELDMTEKETDKIIGNLQEKGKVYRVSEDRVLGV